MKYNSLLERETTGYTLNKHGTDMKVIIADDSKLIRDRITERVKLIDSVNVVAQTTNSFETIDEIEKHKPDLLILDIRMPEGSGINVLKYIQKNKIKIITLVVTNYPIIQYKNKCFELGTDYFFSKASEFDEVFKLVEKLANNHEGRGKRR